MMDVGLPLHKADVCWSCRAAVQVSHMCLVPELSSVDGDRVSLNSARYAALVASNSSVYLLMALWTHLFSVGHHSLKLPPLLGLI